MAVNSSIKIQGVEKLQERLRKMSDVIRKTLDMKLMQVAEEAVTYSKENKGYHDRTANLKNSISYALFYDGEMVHLHEGKIPHPEESARGQEQVAEAIENYASEEGVVADKGYTLIIVAGMEYGKYVEHRGFNVLHLTKYFLEDELKRALEETIEDVMAV